MQHWVYSENKPPKNRRIVLIVRLRCHFIGFFEKGKYWLSSQKDIPINKRLKRTEITQPLFWIDYPKGKIVKKKVKGKVKYIQGERE